jgi:hypothetical protein
MRSEGEYAAARPMLLELMWPDIDLIAVRQIVLGVVDVGIEDGGAEITLVRQPGLGVRRDGKCSDKTQ